MHSNKAGKASSYIERIVGVKGGAGSGGGEVVWLTAKLWMIPFVSIQTLGAGNKVELKLNWEFTQVPSFNIKYIMISFKSDMVVKLYFSLINLYVGWALSCIQIYSFGRSMSTPVYPHSTSTECLQSTIIVFSSSSCWNELINSVSASLSGISMCLKYEAEGNICLSSAQRIPEMFLKTDQYSKRLWRLNLKHKIV